MKRFLSVLLLCVSAIVSMASNDLVVSWNPSPASESNVLYRVYVSTNALPMALAGSSLTPALTILNVPAGTYCVSITASNVWAENAKSAPVCSVGPINVPSPITGVNVFIRTQ